MEDPHDLEAETAAKDAVLRLEANGYRARIVGIQHLSELREEIEQRYSQGSFDEEFYRSRLGFYNFEIPKDLQQAKSIIVVAVPRPQAQTTFIFSNGKLSLILPPTYVGYQRITIHVKELLADALTEKGYHTVVSKLPLKLLAVRSGLAEYGRNNISYVQGMGSFLQLVALYSDMPCSQDSWQEPRMMRQCGNCEACRRSCPTGAISSDRFLLHAEKCLPFHNEKKGAVPFPSWIDSSWHNCIFGCMHCQRVCPEDKRFMSWIGEEEEFSRDETSFLLKGATPDNLPASLKEKLSNLDLTDSDSLSSIPRNLRVLMEQKGLQY